MRSSASQPRRPAFQPRALMLSIAALAALAITGCNAGRATRPYIVQSGGNPIHGKQLIHDYGCGACHIIPGVHGARGLVGPPLYYLGQRTIIAGELPNTADNLAHWIEHPRQVNPNTAMPDLGLSEYQAYDIASPASRAGNHQQHPRRAARHPHRLSRR